MNYEDILFWFFIGCMILAVIALSVVMFYALYRIKKSMDEYYRIAEELEKEGIYVPPLPAAR